VLDISPAFRERNVRPCLLPSYRQTLLLRPLKAMSAPQKTTATATATTYSFPPVQGTVHVQADYVSPKYHPDFSDSDADVVLHSTGGRLYRVHSYTLRTTSGFFESMFSLPQPNHIPGGRKQQFGFASTSTTFLDVYESDFELERVLRLMCGLSIPPWGCLEELERVLHLAEKWDTPGPISVIRQSLTSSRFLASHPLRCYMIAAHFGWVTEAKLASKYTLTLNLYDSIHATVINQMTSKWLLPLLTLHRKRRDMFKDLLNSPERFSAGNRSVLVPDQPS